MKIETQRRDVIWNYIGTIVSMASGFLLLPILLAFLSDDEIGLWYIFVAIANLTLLFEFGFNPALARNIVYCLSGARRLSKKGRDASSIEKGVDWHLLKTLIRASKLLYAIIAFIALLLVSTAGTAYLGFILRDVDCQYYWIAWAVFCVAIFLNLYFYYTLTCLRGFGDIAGESRAKTFARIAQLVSSAVLLALGAGLVGAALGFLINSAVLRILAWRRLRQHVEIYENIKLDSLPVSRLELRSAFSVISFVAWRDGIVQLSCYASTQATSVICSLFFDLSTTGTYSVLLQLGTAVYNFATAYTRSFYPSFQSAYMRKDLDAQQAIVSKGLVAYWILFVAGSIGIFAVVFPVLPIFKPGISLDTMLFLGLLVYLALWEHHSICCNYIINMNEIPYMLGYIVAAVLGVVVSIVLLMIDGIGVWSLVLGPLIAQLIYNNWKWPLYLSKKLELPYHRLIKCGVLLWRKNHH